MPISSQKQRAFRDTEYRVRLRHGGSAVIRIGEPLPVALHHLLRDARNPWGFITAWNPFAQQISLARNRVRQRELLAILREHRAQWRPALGKSVGDHQKRWREPSVFVTGLDFATLDTLGRRFEQAAIVRGIGREPAELRELM